MDFNTLHIMQSKNLSVIHSLIDDKAKIKIIIKYFIIRFDVIKHVHIKCYVIYLVLLVSILKIKYQEKIKK